MASEILSSKRGFTLVEVLVAMVILGVGVIGFIALQTASIQARVHQLILLHRLNHHACLLGHNGG